MALRFRQIHLDFHTSPDIADIGASFSPEEFAHTLELAKVNSVTCFARCHHGMMYYDSKKFPERIHPGLKQANLLERQIQACHQRGIRVPIYITVQWDDFTAHQHPEWIAIDENGKQIGTPPFQAGFYRHLCVNTPYRDFLKAHTQEVLENLDVDGLFFDIVQVKACSCGACQRGMREQGLNPASAEQRQLYAAQMMDEFKSDMTQFVRKFNATCNIFYNEGHVGTRTRTSKEAYSHFELESLPSGQWGYLHFPVTVRYARTLGLDFLAQTGKFHTAWGDYHSFKNQEALEFECFNMLALNAKCLIGDQLEPSGKLSEPVYQLIGRVYEQIEQKEPWCTDAKSMVDLAVFTTEEFYGGGSSGLPRDIQGITRMLQESGHQFDIVDSYSQLEGYRVVILPDRITVHPDLAQKLQAYLASGGALIASYQSGLNPEGTDFALPEFGVKLVGPAPFSPDFLVPNELLGKGLPETEHVMYQQGMEVEAVGAEILMSTRVPYFNRTWEHFSSHRHTPSTGRLGYPGVTRQGNVVYFSHPIFSQYHKNAPKWVKTIFLDALSLFLPQPLLQHDGPSTVLATVNEQAAANRVIVHLLHYIPERRSEDIDIIEDVIPLYHVGVSLREARTVKSVSLVPDQQELSFQEQGGRVEFVVPKIYGHQMVAVEF